METRERWESKLEQHLLCDRPLQPQPRLLNEGVTIGLILRGQNCVVKTILRPCRKYHFQRCVIMYQAQNVVRSVIHFLNFCENNSPHSRYLNIFTEKLGGKEKRKRRMYQRLKLRIKINSWDLCFSYLTQGKVN